MQTIRPSRQRGRANHGWLFSKHTFSFANYYDPEHMGFRSLRVINEDKVAPGAGFGSHPHRDMEILSVVLAGALEHKDSMGNGSVIRPGDVQRMSAGTGVVHSEYNASKDEEVHFLQIWIEPDERGIQPSYEQKHFAHEERRNTLRLLASKDGRDESITIHQDAALWTSRLDEDAAVQYDIDGGRHVWLHVIGGPVSVTTSSGEPQLLKTGDGLAIFDESKLRVEAVSEHGGEFLLFDLA